MGAKRDTAYTAPLPLGALSSHRESQAPNGRAVQISFLHGDPFVFRFSITAFSSHPFISSFAFPLFSFLLFSYSSIRLLFYSSIHLFI